MLACVLETGFRLKIPWGKPRAGSIPAPGKRTMILRKARRFVLLLALAGGMVAAGVPRETPPKAQPIPRWAVDPLRRARIALWTGQDSTSQYRISHHLNPYYLEGDFDGDCRTDLAVLVRRLPDQKTGIAVLFQGSGRVLFLGAGTPFGNEGDDFRWMDLWHVYVKGKVSENVWKGPPPSLVGDALHVEKDESASGIIYYDGSSFRWYQQGD
jgi:hypothetical protein